MVRSFGLGTGTLTLRMDAARREMRVGHCDARMVVALNWDTEEGAGARPHQRGGRGQDARASLERDVRPGEGRKGQVHAHPLWQGLAHRFPQGDKHRRHGPRVCARAAHQRPEPALRLALQVLDEPCGPGINYFDFDNVGYVKTATEV